MEKVNYSDGEFYERERNPKNESTGNAENANIVSEMKNFFFTGW